MPKYVNPKAYRTALEARIVAEHKRHNEDISRLRKKVAFDAALARMYAGDHGFILKGGYALELRLTTTRSTKDLDFVTKRLLRATLSETKEGVSQALRSLIERALKDKVVGDDDFFSFVVAEPMAALVGGGGGYRYPVEARLDGRKFEVFHIDVALGDFVSDLNDRIKRVSKARIAAEPNPEYEVELITKEQHFAEKIHAYTLPRDGVNSRAKDLVDMVLLIRSGLDAISLARMITDVFAHRGTHELPPSLEAPPGIWGEPYLKLARECGIELSMNDAYVFVREFYSKGYS